jgi:hypothetical protein
MKASLVVTETDDEPPTYLEAVEAADARQTYWWDDGLEGVGAPGDRPPPPFSSVVASQAP